MSKLTSRLLPFDEMVVVNARAGLLDYTIPYTGESEASPINRLRQVSKLEDSKTDDEGNRYITTLGMKPISCPRHRALS